MDENKQKDLRKITQMFPKMADWVKDMLEYKVMESETAELGDGYYFTTDPVKMLGCGATVYSSYSPDAGFYDFLPSFIFQKYVGMVYKTDGENVTFEHNGVELECPKYINRCFVLNSPESGLKCMPSYGLERDDIRFATEPKSIVIKSDDKAPEIHLDGVWLFERDNGGHYVVFGNRCLPKDSHVFKDFWSQEGNDGID